MSTLQTEKVSLFGEVSNLKNKIANMEVQTKIHEDQIWSLNCENRKIIDQINFVRELEADYMK